MRSEEILAWFNQRQVPKQDDYSSSCLIELVSDLAILKVRCPRENKMEYKVLLTVFAAVFIAELGDKTQLATMLFATDKDVSKLTVFFGASLALIVASGIGVLTGSFISQYISEKHLHFIAGIGFVGIGIWTLIKA
jgi:putative Ca2+/H+ antiporter (TMEM165/GDT1 family)